MRTVVKTKPLSAEENSVVVEEWMILVTIEMHDLESVRASAREKKSWVIDGSGGLITDSELASCIRNRDQARYELVGE